MTLLLLAVGVALMLWPTKKTDKKVVEYDLSKYEIEEHKPREVLFSEAIACLAKVRERLERGEELKDDELAAIDVLTLALVRGSGK